MLRAYLDGRLICEWPTDYHNLSGEPDTAGWHPRDLFCMAVGTYNNHTDFSRIEVLELAEGGKFVK